MVEFKFSSGSSLERKFISLGKTAKMKNVMQALQYINKNDDAQCSSAHWQMFKNAFERFGFGVVYDRNMAILTTALFAAIARSKCSKIYDWAKIVINRFAKKTKKRKSDADELILLGQALLYGDGHAVYAILHCSPFVAILRELGINDKYIYKYLNRMKAIKPWNRQESKEELKTVNDAFSAMTHIEYHIPEGNKESLKSDETVGLDAVSSGQGKSSDDVTAGGDRMTRYVNELLEKIRECYEDRFKERVLADIRAFKAVPQKAVLNVVLDMDLGEGDDLESYAKHADRYGRMTIYSKLISEPQGSTVANLDYKIGIRFNRAELSDHCKKLKHTSDDKHSFFESVSSAYCGLIADAICDMFKGPVSADVDSDKRKHYTVGSDYVFGLLSAQVDRLKKYRERSFELLKSATLVYKDSPGSKGVSVKQLTATGKRNQRFEVEIDKNHLAEEYNKTKEREETIKLEETSEGIITIWSDEILTKIYDFLGGNYEGEDKWKYAFDLFKSELQRLRRDMEIYLPALKKAVISCDVFPHFDWKRRGSDLVNAEGEKVVEGDAVFLVSRRHALKKQMKFEVRVNKNELVATYDKEIKKEGEKGALQGSVRKIVYGWAKETLKKICEAVTGGNPVIITPDKLDDCMVADFKRELQYALRGVRGSLYKVGEVRRVDGELSGGKDTVYYKGTPVVKISQEVFKKNGYTYHNYNVDFSSQNVVSLTTTGGLAPEDMVEKCVSEIEEKIKQYEEKEVIPDGVPSEEDTASLDEAAGHEPSLSLNDLLQRVSKAYEALPDRVSDVTVDFKSWDGSDNPVGAEPYSDSIVNIFVKDVSDAGDKFLIYIPKTELESLDDKGDLSDRFNAYARLTGESIKIYRQKPQVPQVEGDETEGYSEINAKLLVEAIGERYNKWEDKVAEGDFVNISLLEPRDTNSGYIQIDNGPVWVKRGLAGYEVKIENREGKFNSGLRHVSSGAFSEETETLINDTMETIRDNLLKYQRVDFALSEVGDAWRSNSNIEGFGRCIIDFLAMWGKKDTEGMQEANHNSGVYVKQKGDTRYYVVGLDYKRLLECVSEDGYAIDSQVVSLVEIVRSVIKDRFGKSEQAKDITGEKVKSQGVDMTHDLTETGEEVEPSTLGKEKPGEEPREEKDWAARALQLLKDRYTEKIKECKNKDVRECTVEFRDLGSEASKERAEKHRSRSNRSCEIYLVPDDAKKQYEVWINGEKLIAIGRMEEDPREKEIDKYVRLIRSAISNRFKSPVDKLVQALSNIEKKGECRQLVGTGMEFKKQKYALDQLKSYLSGMKFSSKAKKCRGDVAKCEELLDDLWKNKITSKRRYAFSWSSSPVDDVIYLFKFICDSNKFEFQNTEYEKWVDSDQYKDYVKGYGQNRSLWQTLVDPGQYTDKLYSFLCTSADLEYLPPKGTQVNKDRFIVACDTLKKAVHQKEPHVEGLVTQLSKHIADLLEGEDAGKGKAFWLFLVLAVALYQGEGSYLLSQLPAQSPAWKCVRAIRGSDDYKSWTWLETSPA